MMQGKKPRRAAALQYTPGKDRAPRVIAKGQRKMAEKIIAVARQHHVRIHQDPDLLEALSGLDLNQEIPEDLYIVVAELLAFVYAVNRKKVLE